MIKLLLNSVHHQAVFKRRVRMLAQHLSSCLDTGDKTLLDIGCGDGSIATAISLQRADTDFSGVDVIERPKALIPTTLYDGTTLPFEENSFDSAVLVDVLHHTDQPEHILHEAMRVTRHAVIVKDHLCENLFDFQTLKFMDWVGNRGHDVRLPYNYLPQSRWDAIFDALSLRKAIWIESLNIYPQPFDSVFGRKLHFIARLEPQQPERRVPDQR